MKHIANFIKIVPLHQFNSWDGTAITATTNVDTFESDIDITFTEIPDTKNGNPYYKQTMKLVCDKLDTATRAKYPQNIPVVILLYTDDAQPYILGNENSKLRITIEPTSNEDIITLYRENIDPLF